MPGLAEIENGFGRERQVAGIEQATKKGDYKGRTKGIY
jgi:DNA invertase Pin-like site-specific DNA recombinase